MPRKLYHQGKPYYNAPKYKAMKYLVDNQHSWAVFYHKDVYGLKTPIVNKSIKPLISNVGQIEAREYIKQLLKEDEEKNE